MLRALEGQTLGTVLRRSALEHASRICFIDDGAEVSFQEFDRLVDQVVCGLHGLGVRPRDHVAVWLGNSLQWALLYFACGRLGAVMVPINTRYAPEEVAYVLRESDSVALVMSAELFGRNYMDILLGLCPELQHQHAGSVQLKDFPKLHSIVASGSCTQQFVTPFECFFDVASDKQLLQELERTVDAHAISIICYTSGTTGSPKGVQHDHRVIKQALRVGLALDLRAGDRVLGHMPLYHVAGLYMALVPAILLGAGFVNLRQWQPARALDLISKHRVAVFGGVPTHFIDLCAEPDLDQYDLASMRNAWIGGAPVMRARFEEFKEKLNLQQLMSTYGMTENTISTTFNRLSDPLEICCQNRAPVLGLCEVKVVDTQTGQPCLAGQTGEILCRGETVMRGYYKNEQATRDVITHDGWLKTGDLGDFDANGYLKVTGRLKDMYKSGGINVYPSEVEQVFLTHSAVRLVSVVGVPDDRLGEVGYAFVETHPGHDLDQTELLLYGQQRLAKYKLPKYIELVDEIPRTNTGKVQKAVLAKSAAAKLNLDASREVGQCIGD